MLLKYFYDDRLAQASYLVGCAKTGEALVVDPARDIAPYLAMAKKEGLRITHVAETHIHADFISGARELADATGAQIYLSDMGPEEWKYAYATNTNVITVRDGDSFKVGNVHLQVIHTPGHTPEHIAFIVTDTAGADGPMGMFTGDFVFAGDVGRPDLLEEAAGYVGTKVPGARQQFASIQEIMSLPGYLQLWPGHGAGSACGKALGAIPSTTLGYEMLYNPAFQFNNDTKFTNWLLSDQPEAPRYFAQMKRINKLGPCLLRNVPKPPMADRAMLDEVLAEGHFVVDLRNREDFAAAHVAGTINIPATSRSFITYLGWLVDYARPTYIIVPSMDQVDDLMTALYSIGVDDVRGVFPPEVALTGTEELPSLTAAELAERLSEEDMLILDVRNESEYIEEHIAGAKHLMLGRIPQHLNEIPRDKTVVTQCATGYRSQIAASLLRAHGFTNVITLNDSAAQWAALLPTDTGYEKQG